MNKVFENYAKLHKKGKFSSPVDERSFSVKSALVLGSTGFAVLGGLLPENVYAAYANDFGNTDSATSALALGLSTTDQASATAEKAIALGANASATARNSTAIGSDSIASGTNANAIGMNATSSGQATIAIGAYSNSTTDAGIAIGSYSLSSGTASIALGQAVTASGGGATAIGRYATATGGDAVALGSKATASGKAAAGLTTNSTASGDYSIAAGVGSRSTSAYSVALGSGSNATADFSIALGRLADASGVNATAIGTQSKAMSENATAIGNNAVASNDGSVALGNSSTTREATSEISAIVNNLTYSGFAGSNPSSVVSVGAESGERQIINVAAGNISANSTDAINGSQLYWVADELANYVQKAYTVTSDDGSVLINSVTDSNGTTTFDLSVNASTIENTISNVSWTATSDVTGTGTVSGTSKASVKSGSTVTYVAGDNINLTQDGTRFIIATNENVTFTTVNATTIHANTVEAETVKTGDTTVNNNGITIANGTAGSDVSLTKDGLNNGGNKITNVAAGEADTDAVNVSQLKQSVTNVNNHIQKVDKRLRAGIAGANAAAGLPQVYIPGKSMLAASAAGYDGESALAVGYSHASDNGKIILKVQGNANTRGRVGGSVGVGYQW